MISCGNHDYIEIACMYNFEIKLVLKTGKVVQGKAFQTVYNNKKEECMVLEAKSGNKEIVLEHIAFMEAVTANPHFEKINFK